MGTKYVSSLTGEEMDAALIDMAYHNSEAYAVGTRNGVAVGSSDVTYHNNSKYWAEQVYGYTDRAEDAANRAEAAVPSGTAGAVFFDRAQTLTTAQQEQVKANISAGSTNPNLLDNPFFTVRQRGDGSFTGNTYGIDRWKGNNSRTVVTGGDGYVTLSMSSSGNGVFRQILSQTYEGTYTFSAKIQGNGSGALMVQDSAGTILDTVEFTATGTQIFTQTFTTTGTPIGGVAIRIDSGNSFDVVCAKLELGSVSTLANDVPPNYQEELLKCQRYFLRIAGDSTTAVGYGWTRGTYANITVDLPTPMRATPTISYTGNYQVYAGVENQSVTSITVGALFGNKLRLGFNVASFSTQYRSAIAAFNNTGYIDLSADL